MAAFLRIAMIFLLGVGAAAGAYVTGAADYLSQHNYFLNNLGIAPQSGVVLRVSDVDQARPTCPARYSIQNRSARRLIIVFSRRGSYGAGVAGAGFAPNGAGSYGEQGYPRSNARPSLNDYARYGYAAAAASQSQLPPSAEPFAGAVAVEPGQQRLVSAQDGGVYGGSEDPVRGAVACMDEPPVTLQLTDCATDAAGICNRTGAAAGPANSAVAPPPGRAPSLGYEAAPQGYGAPPQGYESAPQGYGAPSQGYEAAPQGYGAPSQGYEAPPQGYGAPSQGYEAAPQGYGAPSQGYEAAPQGNGAPSQGYEAAPQGNGAPSQGYEAPAHGAPPQGNTRGE